MNKKAVEDYQSYVNVNQEHVQQEEFTEQLNTAIQLKKTERPKRVKPTTPTHGRARLRPLLEYDEEREENKKKQANENAIMIHSLNSQNHAMQNLNEQASNQIDDLQRMIAELKQQQQVNQLDLLQTWDVNLSQNFDDELERELGRMKMKFKEVDQIEQDEENYRQIRRNMRDLKKQNERMLRGDTWVPDSARDDLDTARLSQVSSVDSIEPVQQAIEPKLSYVLNVGYIPTDPTPPTPIMENSYIISSNEIEGFVNARERELKKKMTEASPEESAKINQMKQQKEIEKATRDRETQELKKKKQDVDNNVPNASFKKELDPEWETWCKDRETEEPEKALEIIKAKKKELEARRRKISDIVDGIATKLTGIHQLVLPHENRELELRNWHLLSLDCSNSLEVIDEQLSRLGKLKRNAKIRAENTERVQDAYNYSHRSIDMNESKETEQITNALRRMQTMNYVHGHSHVPLTSTGSDPDLGKKRSFSSLEKRRAPSPGLYRPPSVHTPLIPGDEDLDTKFEYDDWDDNLSDISTTSSAVNSARSTISSSRVRKKLDSDIEMSRYIDSLQ
jgi:hypothetical protein